MRGGLLGVVALLVIGGLWSSLELYVGFVLPAQQRAEHGETAPLASADSEGASLARGWRARCAELLVAGGCDGPASEIPDECAPLCRAVTSNETSPANVALAPAAGGKQGGPQADEDPADGVRTNSTGKAMNNTGAARVDSAGAASSAVVVSQPAATRTAAAVQVAKPPARATVLPALTAVADGAGNPLAGCAALVAAGKCFDDMRFMLVESSCRAACARYRGLPREAKLWVSSASCFGRGAQQLAASAVPTLDTRGYFQLVGGREQMNKNRYLVLDALFYAKALNRTFVEPAMRNSRIVRPPLSGPGAPSAPAQRIFASAYAAAFVEAGIRPPRSGEPAPNYTLGFGSYWEMKGLCAAHRTIDVAAFNRLRARAPRPALRLTAALRCAALCRSLRCAGPVWQLRRRAAAEDRPRAHARHAGRLSRAACAECACRAPPHRTNPSPAALQVAHGLRSVLVLPASRNSMKIGALRLETYEQVQEAFSPFEAYPIIQMDGFYRSAVDRAVPLQLSRRVEAFARRISRQLLGERYMAVQWRSETVSREDWPTCVNSVAGVISRLASRLRFAPAQVLFISDVFPGTSDTDGRGEAARALAVRALDAKMPGMMTHPVHTALEMIVDSGIKAITEQFLAVNAPYFFAASIGQSNCAKADSGFVNTIIRERDKRGLESYPLLRLRLQTSDGRQVEHINVGRTRS